MKTITHLVIAAASALGCLSLQAIPGLKVTIQRPNIVLTWPSTPGQSYIVQSRPSLAPGTPWTTLSDSILASSGSHTSFVISNAAGNIIVTTNVLVANTNMPPTPDPPADPPPDGLVMPASGGTVLLAFPLFPPGYVFEGWLVSENGEWVDGANYEMPLVAAPAAQPVPAGPDPAFYRVVQYGAVLYGLTNGTTISGTVPLTVEVGEPSGNLINLSLDDWGTSITNYTAPYSLPVPVMELNTTMLTNGPHSFAVQAYVDNPGDGTEDGSQVSYFAESSTNTVNVYNEISYPNWMPNYGELSNNMAIIIALGHTNASWSVSFTGNVSGYVGSISGAGTYGGNILISWNMVGADGKTHLDPAFVCGVKETYAALPTKEAVVYSISPVVYKTSDYWPAPGGWAVALMTAWENNPGNELFQSNANAFVTIAQLLGLQILPPPDANGNAFGIPFNQGASSAAAWNTFYNAITNYTTNASTRNLFFLGHGNPKSIGDNTYGITAEQIGYALGTVPPHCSPSDLNPNPLHKYRFVLMDCCCSASGGFPAAFGVYKKQAIPQSFYSAAAERPNVFCGWYHCAPTVFLGSVAECNTAFISAFSMYWAVPGTSVASAWASASIAPGVWPLVTSDMKTYGASFLTINAYND